MLRRLLACRGSAARLHALPAGPYVTSPRDSRAQITLDPAVVSKAFSCLSDPEKRRAYDTYGAEEPAAARGGGGGFARGGGGFGPGGMYGDVDAEEIFNMFFGGNPFMNQRWVWEGGLLCRGCE